ncbi:MAG TPA: invasion associated locus B family protein [Pseudolabrys sp.]|nr:invasion associated locus B family protein [Pseudolabrys sp.]
MTNKFWLSPAFALLAAVALPGAASAQAAKPEAKHATPKAEPKSEPKAAAKPEAKPKSADPTEQAVLLGQFDGWGAYKATPGGKKVCFALAKPTSATTDPANKKRDPSYAFISTRPSEKVKNEVSVIVGYPQKSGIDASAAIGSTTYVMYTQNDGAWVKNAADEAKMVSAMRNGGELVVKSESGRATKSTDVFSLKGIGPALDKVAEECK